MIISRIKAVPLPLAFILVVAVSPWVLIGATIPPSEQNFPLIDEWAFTRGAYSFFHNHELDYQYWASIPLLGQWLWSVPFLAVLGDSYLAARASTIVLSWLGLWAFYTLLRRQAGVSPPLAAFATACLAWNPFFFVLSGTFMTDVPTLSFSLIALAFYTHALDSGRLLSLAAATLAALAAVSTRQNAIAAPLTAGVLLLRSGYRSKPLWLTAVAVPIVAALVLDAWLAKRPDVVSMHARLPTVEDLNWRAFTSVHYLGLLAAPLLVLLPPARLGKAFWVTLLFLTANAFWQASLGQFWRNESVFPYVEDLFSARGIFVSIESEEDLFGWSVRLLPTALGCVGAAAWISRAAEQGWRLATRPLVVFSLLQLAALAIVPRYSDRYLLPLVPGALSLAVGQAGRPRWKAGVAALVVLGVLSVGLMHDWLSRNAACWDLGRRAVVHDIEPSDIQGGFEWDHWHQEWDHWFPRYYPLPTSSEGIVRALQDFRMGHPGHYRLSLCRHDDTIDVEPFSQWFPPQKRVVYLTRRPRLEIDIATQYRRLSSVRLDELRKKERPPEQTLTSHPEARENRGKHRLLFPSSSSQISP